MRSEHSAPRRRGYSDLVLAGGVLVIMALMVLRLPVALIDALVALNIATGLALLLFAIYIPRPTAFNSFPSVLLISTLFRLALSVATTRLILLEADAGNIIDAFGHFVAGGNLVVGLVVFVIITVVQFIVIAKGAERVAEVAARFTLDAMPGKQLSIDSDLRSGLIDQQEARRRRDRLEEESQLNGALDGAMKFVKGDAIASIIIVLVNLVAGLTIGVVQRDMSFGNAAQVYSILTIGDGMVAQIPALLGAMAAGLVVTRTSNDVGDRHLGETIGRQLFNEPTALMVTGAIAVLLALVPGFPALVFLGIAGALLLMAYVAAPHRFRAVLGSLVGRTEASSVSAEIVEGAVEDQRFSAPLVVEYGDAVSKWVLSPQARTRLDEVGDRLTEELGVPIPRPLMVGNPMLPENAYHVLVFDVAVADGEIQGDDPESLAEAVETALRSHASRFLGLQEVSEILDVAADRYPALVKEVGRVVSGYALARILRNLVDESVPIRNLRDILENLVEWGERENDPGALAEFARIGLRQYLTATHVSPEGVIQAIVLHPSLEETLRGGLRDTPAGVSLTVSPAIAGEIRGNLQTILDTLVGAAAEVIEAPIVLLVSIDIRRHLRGLVRHDFPTLPVLSFQELEMPVDIVPLGQLTVSTSPRLSLDEDKIDELDDTLRSVA